MKIHRKLYKISLYALAFITICGCTDNEEATGDLNLTLNLVYNGEPLVMFQDYEYPDGRTINFSKFSLYISDVNLDATTISEVAFHNLTNSHVDLAGANVGYEWLIEDIASKTYSSLNFGTGVNAIENAKDPGIFESGHPLAKPAEHWFSWSSFIFLKLEANMDSNGDGINNLPIALHLGDDDAYRVITLDKNIEIKDDEVTKSSIEIDLFKFLGGSENTYDVDANPQIHSLEQTDVVVELANNLIESFK